MQYVSLGRRGPTVSRMCFGTLTMGPLQARLPIEAGGRILSYAIERGVTFCDTAQLYETYPHIRSAMEQSGFYELVISSKTYAHTRQLAIEAVEQARKELNRDYIDIFMLHEQESIHTLRGHQDALETLLEYKQKGIIRAVGASMHHIAAVKGAVQKELDVIHPLLNLTGLGIVDGSRVEMEQVVERAHQAGMGVFSMKPLGGGNLFRQAESCLTYALSLPYIDSVAIGMQSIEEVDANLSFWQNGAFSSSTKKALDKKQRKLHLEDWCEGCGRCVERCSQEALAMQENRAVCRHGKCVLCGYCSTVCPAWAIKIV